MSDIRLANNPMKNILEIKAPTVGCCDDAIKTMLAANRKAINIRNIGVICLTCNKVWTSEEARK